MIPQEIFSHIRRLQILTTRRVNTLFAGAYRSAFKGRGLEFEEVREYQQGDDVRTIDWNVTARAQHPYVKNFREERELTIVLLVDVSASSHFGSSTRMKSEVIAEIGAILAFSAIKNNDKVGLILFSDRVELYLSPKKSLRHVLRVIRELLYFQPTHKGTDLKAGLDFLGRVQRKHCVCFLISDFLSVDFGHEAALMAKRHELVAIHVDDLHERVFPKVGLIELKDLESGEKRWVDTNSEQVQKEFQQKVQRRLQTLNQMMKSIGVSLIQIDCRQPYTDKLRNFFKYRKRRR